MSKLLKDLVSDKIDLGVCLQRLLVIANKINNRELSEWCANELNGYQGKDVPEYRKYESNNIVYTGIIGVYQLTNQPMQPGYLSSKTLKEVAQLNFYENIYDVIERKNQKNEMYRDLTYLSSEVLKNTKGNLQCTSIRQVVSTEIYSKIYSAVKVRVINMLCALENAKVNIDKMDVVKAKKIIDFDAENSNLYETIIKNGDLYKINPKESKIIWNILMPIITGILAAILSSIIIEYFKLM